MALALTACGAEKTTKQDAIPTCPANCGGVLDGNPEFRCDLYNSRLYQAGTVSCGYDAPTNSCQVVVSACVEIPDAALFKACEGAGQGNCEDGLECAALSPTKSVCLIPCQDHTVCADVGGVAGACVGTSQTGGHCFQKSAQLNESCGIETYSVCADGQGSCTASKVNLIRDPSGSGFSDQESVDYRCKPVCDPTGADAQATTCGGNQTCLAAPTGSIMGVESKTSIGSQADQNNSDDFRTCEKDATDTEQCSAGYECTALQFGGGESGDFCTLFEHWCGESAGFCEAFDRVGMTTCAQQTPCNVAPEYNMCAVIGATDTPANTTCWGNFQIDGGDLYPMCVASCEDSEIKNAAGDDLKLLDCGTGYSCKTPAADKELGHTHQSAIDEAFAEDATCTEDTECNTEKGFACISAGQGEPKSCNRPIKTCVATAE